MWVELVCGPYWEDFRTLTRLNEINLPLSFTGENGPLCSTSHYSLIKHLLSLRTGLMMAPLAKIRKSRVGTVLGGNNNKSYLYLNAYHMPSSYLIFIFGKVGISNLH